MMVNDGLYIYIRSKTLNASTMVNLDQLSTSTYIEELLFQKRVCLNMGFLAAIFDQLVGGLEHGFYFFQ